MTRLTKCFGLRRFLRPSQSPEARKRAVLVLWDSLPVDSMAFLSETAPVAARIFSLARSVIRQYPSAARQFKTVFLPNSHFRHMMYNEGVLAMYSTLKDRSLADEIKQGGLDLWYSRRVVNIAGFRGHVSPKGSLYLSQNTYRAMTLVKQILDRTIHEPTFNPVVHYLQRRGQWLHLNSMTSHSREFMALASLAASLQLFSAEEGKQLYANYKSLPESEQKRWVQNVNQNL